MTPFDSHQFLNECALAMLFGLLGQGLRAASGLHSKTTTASDGSTTLAVAFDKSRFWFSLFVGACAGLAAYLGMYYSNTPPGVDWGSGKLVFGLVAAGYAGADFVDGFVKKYLPKTP